MRARSRLPWLAVVTAAAFAAPPPAASQEVAQPAAAPAEPTVPAEAVALELGTDEKPVLRDGKATPAAYQLFTFRPPAGRTFELRLFAEGVPEGSVSMAIYRGDSKTPEPGAEPADLTLMWMSTGSGETFRVLVLGHRPGETPFQIGAKLYPEESDDGESAEE